LLTLLTVDLVDSRRIAAFVKSIDVGRRSPENARFRNSGAASSPLRG